MNRHTATTLRALRFIGATGTSDPGRSRLVTRGDTSGAAAPAATPARQGSPIPAGVNPTSIYGNRREAVSGAAAAPAATASPPPRRVARLPDPAAVYASRRDQG